MRKGVLKGKICPYCGMPTKYVDSTIIYRVSYGMIYLCSDCEAWVGVHKGTDKALGRLANKELRKLKIEAHKYFDLLWKKKMEQGHTKIFARNSAYNWLADKMGIDVKDCHIGMFDEQQCKRVLEICKPFF